MEFPVEATVHVSHFRDEAAALALLESHGFELTDVGGGQVCVKGCFQQLRAVKVRLEQLEQTESTPRSPGPTVSPGAISRYYSKTSGGARTQSRVQPAPSSPSSSSSQRRPASWDSGRETFVVDLYVFMYAQRYRNEDLQAILDRYEATMRVREVGDSISITLKGKYCKMAARTLQRLLHDLSQSLRTQEVLLRDARQHGAPLLAKLGKSPTVIGPVLVCETDDRLYLVGPSKQSYELKQRLLGRPADQSGRKGRSMSLPPANRRSPGRGGAAGDSTSPDDRPPGAAAPGQAGPPTRIFKPKHDEKKGSGLMKRMQTFVRKRFSRSSVQKKSDGRKIEGKPCH